MLLVDFCSLSNTILGLSTYLIKLSKQVAKRISSLSKNISHEILPIRERYYNFKSDQDNLQQIITTGCKKAAEKAEKQVEIVRKAIGL